MAIKELEELSFVFQVGQLVLHTAKSIIKDENLLGSNGTFATCAFLIWLASLFI